MNHITTKAMVMALTLFSMEEVGWALLVCRESSSKPKCEGS